jgi:glycosyltransferase involved in cell wall biosynthesis
MRLLITLPWGQRLGGAEAMLQTVLDGAHETGHELELVFFEPGPWPTELSDAGFRVEVIAAGRLRRADRWAAAVTQLAGILRRRQPDLILNWSAKTQLYGSPAAVLAGMADRVLWWQHGIPARHWLDRCATALPAVAVGCSSSASARAQSRLSPQRPTFVVPPGTRSPGMDSGGMGFDGAVSDGATSARTDSVDTRSPHASSNGGRSPHASSDGARSPDTNSQRASLELPPGVPVVGLVGRLEPWKGQDRLLSAHAILRERGHTLHTVLVGGDAYDISPQYARSLPPLVDRLGLQDAVTMTGQVPDAGPYIDQLDVLVSASDGEPFGIVILEGMARGVAVLAVDSGGPAELIEHGRTGLLARSSEPSALADALESLLVSPALRRTLGEAGRELYAREFTDVAMSKRFFHHLEALLEDRHATVEARVPPDVTIVAHDLGSVGGMERQMAELVTGLRRLGHEVTVIARTCELPAGAGIAFHRVRGPSRPFLLAYPWFMVAGSLAVRRHRHGVVQATGAIVLNRVDSIAIHCCHQAYRAMPGRPTRLFRWYGKAVGVLKRATERLCFRANSTASFICVSDGVAEEIRVHYPAAADRVVTIHNGVDTEAFAPRPRGPEALALRAELGIPGERLVVAFVGGDWEHKGLRWAIEALAQAPDWDLVVAGRGHAPRYQEMADVLGVGARVHWLGVVQDIQIVYELADAFVLPSSYETFSLVTFEAAASGLPILATPVNGVRELIQDSHNGFLIAAEPREIAECLGQLAADPALRTRLGRAARQSALEFGWEEMVTKHHELYEELADRGAKAGDAAGGAGRSDPLPPE